MSQTTAVRQPTTTTIRTATTADSLFVRSLQKRFSNQLGFLPNAAVDECIDGGCVRLATENDDPCGYVLSRRRLKCAPHVAPIVQAAVCLDARRRHHGLTLIESVCQDAWVDGKTIVQCWCRADLDAVDFWDAAGFDLVAERDPRSARGKPLLLFRRALPGCDPASLSVLPRRSGWKASLTNDGPSPQMMLFGHGGPGIPDVR
jgi:hypothetical protein